MKLKNFIILTLMLLCIESKAQTTVVNVDSSNTVNIYNYGTVIENDRGTVNVNNGTNSSSDKVELDEDSTKELYEAIDRCEHRLSEIQEYDWMHWLGLILCALPILTAIPAIVDESKFWAILSVSLFISGIIIMMIHGYIIN